MMGRLLDSRHRPNRLGDSRAIHSANWIPLEFAKANSGNDEFGGCA
jgi:hypothetical protein